MSDLKDVFFKYLCTHCKTFNFWLPHQRNTIQTCPRCKINSYIPPEAEQEDVDSKK